MSKDEHLAVLAITSAGTYNFAIPKGGEIKGVYSIGSPVTIGYNDNGSVGTLMQNVSVWEPNPSFTPAAIAYLVVTASAPTNVSIRYVV